MIRTYLKKIIFQQLGSTFIPIMIAVAALAATGVVMMKRYQDNIKSAETIEIKNEYETILNDIKSILSDPESCKATFLDWIPNDYLKRNQVSIYDKSSGLAVEKYRSNINTNIAPSYGISKVKISSVVMGDRNDPTVGFSTDPVDGYSNVLITFYFNDKRFGSNELEKKIRLKVRLNNSTDKKVVACSTAGDSDLDGVYLPLTGGKMTGNITMADGFQIQFLSDKRMKSHILDVSPSLQKIIMTNPVSYTWRRNGNRAYGVLAQEFKIVFPELVYETSADNLAVDYIQLTPILVKGLQELKTENEELKKEIGKLYDEHLILKKNICNQVSHHPLCRE